MPRASAVRSVASTISSTRVATRPSWTIRKSSRASEVAIARSIAARACGLRRLPIALTTCAMTWIG